MQKKRRDWNENNKAEAFSMSTADTLTQNSSLETSMVKVSVPLTFSWRLSASSLCVASLSSCARRWAVSVFRYSISLQSTQTHIYTSYLWLLFLLSSLLCEDHYLLLLVLFNQSLGLAVFSLEGLVLRLGFLQVFIHRLKTAHTHTHKQTQSGSENKYIWVIINPLVDWDVKWWGNYFIQSWLIVASWHLAFLNKLPYTETVPPSNSPPVSPSSLYCPGCFAPTERAPSANATYPAPREPAGGKGWECGRRRWYVGGRASVKSSFSQQRKLMLC